MSSARSVDTARFGGDPAWIAPAVHFLVVPVRDHRDVLQLPGPRDALQKLVGVCDVAFDFVPFSVVQAALADREVAHLVG